MKTAKPNDHYRNFCVLKIKIKYKLKSEMFTKKNKTQLHNESRQKPRKTLFHLKRKIIKMLAH